MGIKLSKQGIYEAKAGQTISMHEHAQIMMQFQQDMKVRHMQEIERMKEIYESQKPFKMIKQKIADLQAHHDRAEKAEKTLQDFFDECTYNMKIEDEMEQVYKTISTLKDLQKRYKAEAKAIFTEYNNQKTI